MTQEYKVNQRIEANRVSLVLEDGSLKGEMDIKEALLIADSANLDLVEVSGSKGEEIPVCKILDYGKMMYQQNKRKKSNKQISHTKEIKYSFNISPHDLEVKHKKVLQFLFKHYVVRYVLELRGREKYLQQEAMQKIKENLKRFEEIAVWQDPHISGNNKRVEVSTVIRAK